MADQFVAEIRIFAGNFAPTGWALCNGQVLPLSQNTALFSLLGTTYGGNGISTFALPDLQGSAPMHPGQGPGLSERLLGEQAGEATVTLLVSEMPVHTPSLSAQAVAGSQPSPQDNIWCPLPGRTPPSTYSSNAPNVDMSANALASAGASLPHNNMSPYLGLNFIIALQGVFPPRS